MTYNAMANGKENKRTNNDLKRYRENYLLIDTILIHSFAH